MRVVFFVILAFVALFLFSSFFIRGYYFIWKLKYVTIGLFIGAVFGYLAGKKA